jgi:acyl-CoA thioesterase FadM
MAAMLRLRAMQAHAAARSSDDATGGDGDRPEHAVVLDAATVPSFDGQPRRRLFALGHRVRVDETSALVPHANNVAILGWIDALASRHGAACGAARDALASEGRMWFVASHEIRYLGESFAGDELVLACWCPSVGRTSLVRESRVLARRDGRILVSATSRWAHVDLATRRPVPFPTEVREALLG